MLDIIENTNEVIVFAVIYYDLTIIEDYGNNTITIMYKTSTCER